jgi:hypothetical protein
MAEDSAPKYSSQAIEAINLFERRGRSFFGLLLLEIAWTLLFLLASKLSADSKGVPTLGFTGLPLVNVWTAGAVLLLIIWLFYSRIFHYFYALIRLVTKPFIDYGFYLVLFAAIVINIILLPLAFPLELYFKKRWLREQRAEKLKSFREGGDSDPEKSYEEWLAKFRETHGTDALEKLASEKIPFHSNFLIAAAGLLGEKLLTPVHSAVRIGFAPLVRYSESDGIVLSREPLQVFADGIGAARAQLAELEFSDYIHFHALPSHLPITTHQRATFARSLFRSDLLIWGRFHEGPLATIYLDMPALNDARDRSDRDEYGNQYQNSLFSGLYEDLRVTLRAVTHSIDDSSDAYILLLLAIVLALQRRRKVAKPKWGWFGNLDRIYRAGRPAINRIIDHLIFDVFYRLPDQAVDSSTIPSVKVALAQTVGNWVGRQIGGTFSTSEEDHWKFRSPQRFHEQLEELIQKCITLEPLEPKNHYRLGAIRCLRGNKRGALQAFRRAGELDKANSEVRIIGAQVSADFALRWGDRGSLLETDLGLARFAAHVACALNNGHASAAESIREKMQKSRTLKYLDPQTKHTALAVVDELLNAASVAP